MVGKTSIAAVVISAVALAAPAAAVAPGTNVLISRPAGTGALTTPTTNDSRVTGFGSGPGSSEASRVVSTAQNNRYIAFTSEADGLSPDDDDSATNVYVRDTLTNTVRLVSRADGPAGAGANGESFDPAISADGRYVAYTSEADNLAGGTGSGLSHVYLRDTLADTTTLVDRADGPNGAVASDESFDPALTVVGNQPKVAFASTADNLDGTSVFTQVFVRDSSDTERVSLKDATTATAGDSSSSSPTISADGTRVAFATTSTNLLAVPEANNASDIYMRTLATNDTVLVSLEGVTLGDDDSYSPAINGDGTAVAFVSESTNWAGAADTSGDQDVYVRTFNPNDALTLASRADGVGGTKGNGDSHNVSIDDSGQAIVFSSDANNLDTPDSNGAEDVFARTGVLGGSPNTTLVSRQQNAVETDGPSSAPSIAGAPFLSNNFRVVFETQADNIGADDENDFTQVYVRTIGSLIIGPNPAQYISRPETGVFRSGVNDSALRATTRGTEPVDSASDDGRYTVFISESDELAADDDDRFVNVFRRDNQTGETTLISRASGAAGAAGNGSSGEINAGGLVISGPTGAPAISADGNRIAFSSGATNLVPGDNNGLADVFVRDVAAATTTRVSVQPGGGQLAFPSGDPAISGDGNRVAFVTPAAIDPQDGNATSDVYLRDLGAGTTTLISRRGIGAPAGDDTSGDPALDADGSHVAFDSVASDLAPAAVNDVSPIDPDVYLVAVASGIPQLVNPDAGDATPPINTSDEGASGPALDADASKVAFTSGSTDLGAQGNLAGVDVFVRDIPTAQTELVSRTATTPSVSGNLSSEGPSINGAGDRVAFESIASNLVAGDVNGATSDVFVRDLTAGITTLAALTPTGAQPALGSEAASLSGNGDCLVFQSTSDEFFAMPPGTDFIKVFGRALRGDCPFAAIPDDGGGGGGGGGADATPPVFSNVKIKPKRFLAGAKVRRATDEREAVGGKLRYRLSEQAAVTITIQRKKTGKTRGTLTQSGNEGKNRLKITGTVKEKLLKPGPYRLVLAAEDPAGNDAVKARVGFKILRP